MVSQTLLHQRGSGRPCAPARGRRPLQVASEGSSLSYTTTSTPNSLQRSAQLARHRAFESDAEQPLFSDPFADTLAAQVEQQGLDAGHLAPDDVLTTWFVDQQLLRGVALVNMELEQEYRQVVLVGDAMDTRPYRLPWPPGTVLYLVGPPEVHEFAEAVMQQQGGHVPRGCLLRRVRVDMQAWLNPSSTERRSLQPLQGPLERAGYRGDRLSVWALQGYSVPANNPAAALQQLLIEVANNAAFGSIVVGQMTGVSPSAANDLLGSFGLLGAAAPSQQAAQELWEDLQEQRTAVAGEPFASNAAGVLQGVEGASGAMLPQHGRIGAWSRLNGAATDGTAGRGSAATRAGKEGQPTVLFCAQHKRLSLQQMQLRDDHISAQEEAGEDFFGNFS